MVYLAILNRIKVQRTAIGCALFLQAAR